MNSSIDCSFAFTFTSTGLKVGSSSATGQYIFVERDSSDTTYDFLYGKAKYPRITFEDTMDAYGFNYVDGDAGVKFYVNNNAKLDAWVMGDKMANVGRLTGKDNKIFKNPMKMGDWIEKKFKLKNKHLDD